MRSAAGLLLAVAVQAATLVRGPYLQNVQPDRATILWATREPGRGSITYTDGAKNVSVAATVRVFLPAETHLADPVYQFQAELTGLAVGASYPYSIFLNGEALTSAPSRLTTASTGPFSFLAFGDSGSGSADQLQLGRLINAEPAVSFVIHTGDLAYDAGTFAEFDSRYFEVYGPLMAHAPFFPTPGNHEYYTDQAFPYLSLHVLPDSGGAAAHGRYYSFDWGDAHFVSLDSTLISDPASEAMLAWLERDLKASRKFWKVLYFHHTPYPSGHHLEDAICALARQLINPIAERNGVQLVLNGHEHSYQRTLPLAGDSPVDPGYGTMYVNTSGGGGGLQSIGKLPVTAVALQAYNYVRADVNGGQLTFHAVGLDQSELDRVVLAPMPVVSAVVSSGDFGPKLGAGSLVTIFGRNLALRESSAATANLPTQLSSSTVTMNGTAVPLLYVSPTQINAQIPFEVSGTVTVRVVTANGSAQTDVTVAEVAPAVLSVYQGEHAITPDHPARAGLPVTVYATGLGRADDNSGLDPVAVVIADRTLVPTFTRVEAGAVGTYEVSVTLPADLASGSYPLRIVDRGVSSSAVTMPVDGRN